MYPFHNSFHLITNSFIIAFRRDKKLSESEDNLRVN